MDGGRAQGRFYNEGISAGFWAKLSFAPTERLPLFIQIRSYPMIASNQGAESYPTRLCGSGRNPR